MASNDVGRANERHDALAKGEAKLRSHLPPLTPLTIRCTYVEGWTVNTRFHPEGAPPVELSTEPLEGFPSPTLIALAMLVA
jgi:hypothetical protein